MNQNADSQDLSVLLGIQVKQISGNWINLLHQIPKCEIINIPEKHLHKLINSILKGIIGTLELDDFKVLEPALNDLYHTAFEQGSDLTQVIDMMFLLKEVIMSKLRGVICPGTPPMYVACSKLDSSLRYSVSYLARKHTSETNLYLQEEHQRIKSLLEIVKDAASTLNLDEVLKRVGETIRVGTNTDKYGFCMIDIDRGIMFQNKITNGTAHLQDTIIHPLPLNDLDDFDRYILDKKEPCICSNAETDPRIIHEWAEYYKIKSILAVPFIIKGQVIAIVYTYTQKERREFNQEEIDLVWGIANAVALAIENARLHKKTREMAVMEERDRLARELHDNLAQTLGAMQLKASQAVALLSHHSIQKVFTSLDELQEMIIVANIDVRETIFNMRTMCIPSFGFLSALQQYLDAYRNHYGVEVRLFINDDLMTDLEGETGIQVIRIIQESLTNVRKHSKSNCAAILIMRNDNQVEISIHDHGCGFNLVDVMDQSDQHIGLQVMQERAESIGGRLTINSQPGCGTVISLSIPISIL